MRTTLEVDGLRLAVGAPDERVDGALRAALPTHVVDDDPEAPTAYVLTVPDGGRGLFLLHRYHCPAVRGRSAARLLDGLRRHVAADAGRRPQGLVGVRAVALGTADGVVVVPDHARRRLVARASRLAAGGAEPLDEPLLGLDPATGEAVVGPPPLEADPAGVEAFAALGGGPAQPPLRAPLRAMAVPAREDDPAPRATMALHLLALVDDDAHRPATVLDAALAAVASAAPLLFDAKAAGDSAELLSRLP